MPNNAPHNALRNAVNRAIANGSPVITNQPRGLRTTDNVLAAMSRENTTEWHFFVSYVGAALWSSTDDQGEPLDDNRDRDDIATATLDAMRRDCAAFYAANELAIHCEDAPLSRDFEGSYPARQAAMAGHDFWLTRCGHGAGFWDGDWPEPYASQLDHAARAMGNVDLYVGDDGKVYAS